MNFIFEIGLPWLWRPGHYNSSVIRRVWWGWFAISYLKVSLREFAETEYQWELKRPTNSSHLRLVPDEEPKPVGGLTESNWQNEKGYGGTD